MVNNVVLMGRIANDLEVKVTPSGIAVLSFNIAIERPYSKNDEEKKVDFITCVAWKQRASFIEKYFGKGKMIAVTGALRSRTYDDKDGIRHYVTEVLVDSVSFTGEKKSESGENKETSTERKNSEQPPTVPDNSERPVDMGNLEDYEDVLNDYESVLNEVISEVNS